MAKSIALTDFKNLRVLRTNIHQDRRLAKSNLRSIFGLDTETENGNIFLIADSQGRYLEDITPESCLKFLFSKRYQGTWNFFFNLSYDAEVILKLLGNTLNLYKKTRNLDFEFNDYKIQYIPGKKLAIRKGHHSAVFFDIAQFYHASLVNAYQNNIGKLDDQYLDVKNKRKYFSKRFYNNNKNLVRNYCIKDCILTKELAEHWIRIFQEAFGFYPQRWISSGYLAEKVLLNNHIDIPKFKSIPYDIQDLAFRSYFGGRFEILKRGFIGKAYLYDINSAYPYALTNFPDVTKGRWVKRKTIHTDSKLGFFKILADVPDCKYVPPFPFRVNSIIFPSGKFQTYVTLAELQACDNPKYYKILESYQFISKSENYPYKNFVEDLYQKRLQLKQNNSPLEKPIKIILNSIYGKTGQKINGRIGNLFNPVLFAFITGYTRAQLYKFIQNYQIERDIVAFATDSVCCTRKLSLNSTKLGEFSFDNEADDVFYLQNGFYRFNEKWKQRGLGNLGTKEIEHLDTIERGDDLFYTYKVLRSNRLRSSILSDSISDIGKFTTFERQVNLNADNKRLWFEKLRSIQEKKMINSMPINLNYF